MKTQTLFIFFTHEGYGAISASITIQLIRSLDARRGRYPAYAAELEFMEVYLLACKSEEKR
jgi:hypothetical protein